MVALKGIDGRDEESPHRGVGVKRHHCFRMVVRLRTLPIFGTGGTLRLLPGSSLDEGGGVCCCCK